MATSATSSRSPRRHYNASSPVTQSPRYTGVEKKALEFKIEIKHVSFNYAGQYFLRCSVQSSSNPNPRDIGTRYEDDKEWNFNNECRSELTKWLIQDEQTILERNKYYFYLPHGYCKNDNRHDVYLLIEAFEVKEANAKAELIGQAKLPIYPKTDVFVDTNVDMGDPFYRQTANIKLLRTDKQALLHMHCGTIFFTAILCETIPFEVSDSEKLTPPKKRSTAPPPPPQQPPPPIIKPVPKILIPPPSRITPRGAPRQLHQIREDPNEDVRIVDPRFPEPWHHVAKSGQEEVLVQVHGARGLLFPTRENSRSNTQEPNAFVTLRSKHDEDHNLPAPGVTHASIKATSDPLIEEAVLMSVDEGRKMLDELIILDVADRSTREVLANYRFPIDYLQPYHHYHLDLQLPKLDSNPEDESEHLYVSIVRRLATLPPNDSQHQILALEATLIGLRQILASPSGSILAVCRIVSDLEQYQQRRPIGLQMEKVNFPTPHSSLLSVSDKWPLGQGQPQISLPGRPILQPIWRHPYLFCEKRELATLFTRGAGLVIEFYVVKQTMSETQWRVQQPVGISTILLDKRAYELLNNQSATNGIFVEAKIQSSSLKTVANKQASVGLILRLISSQRPFPLSENDFEILEKQGNTSYVALPHLSAVEFRNEQSVQLASDSVSMPLLETNGDQHLDELSNDVQKNKGPFLYDLRPELLNGLPKNSSLYDPYLLPHKLRETDDVNFPSKNAFDILKEQSHFVSTTSLPTSNIVSNFGDDISYEQSPIDRELLRRMGKEILATQEEIRFLELANSQLRMDFQRFKNPINEVLHDVDTQQLNKGEIIARYVGVREHFLKNEAKLNELKERALIIQNEMLHRDGRELQLDDLQYKYAASRQMSRDLQAKVDLEKTLTATALRQEKAIQRLEHQLKSSGEKPSQTEMQKILREENEKLCQEISKLRKSRPQNSITSFGPIERFELEELMEKAKSRVAALESQISNVNRSRQKKVTRVQLFDDLKLNLPTLATTQNSFSRYGNLQPKKELAWSDHNTG